MSRLRVLIALGGNAMTGPDGGAAPGDQDRAIGVAMQRVADLVGAGRRRRAHPRQRPAGRQPAGQERARRARRPAGAAGLVRRPDAGHHRLPDPRRAGGGAGRRAGCDRRVADRGDPDPRRRRRPRLRQPTKPIGRYLPEDQARALMRARPDLGGPRRDGAGAGWSPRRSRSRSSTPPRSPTLAAAGYVVVGAGGGGIPVVRGAGRRPARRRGGHRQGPRRRAARPGGRRRRAGDRDRRRARRSSATAPPTSGRSAGSPPTRCARIAAGARLRRAAAWARRSRPPCGSSRPAARARSSRRWRTSSEAVHGRAGTVIEAGRPGA